MTKAIAQRIVDNPKAVAAFSYWSRRPMETDDATFQLAMDFAQALLVLGK